MVHSSIWGLCVSMHLFHNGSSPPPELCLVQEVPPVQCLQSSARVEKRQHKIEKGTWSLSASNTDFQPIFLVSTLLTSLTSEFLAPLIPEPFWSSSALISLLPALSCCRHLAFSSLQNAMSAPFITSKILVTLLLSLILFIVNFLPFYPFFVILVRFYEVLDANISVQSMVFNWVSKCTHKTTRLSALQKY